MNELAIPDPATNDLVDPLSLALTGAHHRLD